MGCLHYNEQWAIYWDTFNGLRLCLNSVCKNCGFGIRDCGLWKWGDRVWK